MVIPPDPVAGGATPSRISPFIPLFAVAAPQSQSLLCPPFLEQSYVAAFDNCFGMQKTRRFNEGGQIDCGTCRVPINSVRKRSAYGAAILRVAVINIDTYHTLISIFMVTVCLRSQKSSWRVSKMFLSLLRSTDLQLTWGDSAGHNSPQ